MNLFGNLARRFPKSPKTSIINRATSINQPFSNLYPLFSLNFSSRLYNSNPKPPPSSSSQFNYDKPPKSDTIIPTPLSSAFKNMFDDSAIRSSKMISRLTKDGFITRDEIEVKGPVILINGEIFMWDVPQGQGFNQGDHRKGGLFDNWIIDFLKLFEVIMPKPGEFHKKKKKKNI